MVFGGVLGVVAGPVVMMVYAVLVGFECPGVWVYFVGPGAGLLVGAIVGMRAASLTEPMDTGESDTSP
jgi:hypothetical protein